MQMVIDRMPASIDYVTSLFDPEAGQCVTVNAVGSLDSLVDKISKIDKIVIQKPNPLIHKVLCLRFPIFHEALIGLIKSNQR